MILTNLLLSFGFSIATNFGHMAALPSDLVPTTPQDLKSYRVGDFHSPANLYLQHNRGTTFAIEDGAVWDV